MACLDMWELLRKYRFTMVIYSDGMMARVQLVNRITLLSFGYKDKYMALGGWLYVDIADDVANLNGIFFCEHSAQSCMYACVRARVFYQRVDAKSITKTIAILCYDI